jgi:hypothetical protein
MATLPGLVSGDTLQTLLYFEKFFDATTDGFS